MWRNRKIIVAVLVGALLVTGLIGGVALAQDNAGGTPANTNDSQPKLLERVAEILGIDQQQLEDAFAQARTERQDAALQNYLDKLVAEDKITQDEADEYWTWWHSKPDMTPYQQWKEAQPDLGVRGLFGGHGSGGGMKRGGFGFFKGK